MTTLPNMLECCAAVLMKIYLENQALFHHSKTSNINPRLILILILVKSFWHESQRCTGVHRIEIQYTCPQCHLFETGTICRRLLDSARRVAVYPGDSGSSGMVARNSSNCFLNTGSSTLVMFLKSFGRMLNS